MEEKVSIASCNGMSALGLISRFACTDLASENKNTISICITATAADNKEFTEIIKKYPVLAVNGCSDSCANKILEKEGVKVEKSIFIDKFLENNGLRAGDSARLDKNGEKSVTEVKKAIEKELSLD